LVTPVSCLPLRWSAHWSCAPNTPQGSHRFAQISTKMLCLSCCARVLRARWSMWRRSGVGLTVSNVYSTDLACREFSQPRGVGKSQTISCRKMAGDEIWGWSLRRRPLFAILYVGQVSIHPSQPRNPKCTPCVLRIGPVSCGIRPVSYELALVSNGLPPVSSGLAAPFLVDVRRCSSLRVYLFHRATSRSWARASSRRCPSSSRPRSSASSRSRRSGQQGARASSPPRFLPSEQRGGGCSWISAFASFAVDFYLGRSLSCDRGGPETKECTVAFFSPGSESRPACFAKSDSWPMYRTGKLMAGLCRVGRGGWSVVVWCRSVGCGAVSRQLLLPGDRVGV